MSVEPERGNVMMGTLGGSPNPPAMGYGGHSPPAPDASCGARCSRIIPMGTLAGSPNPPATGSGGRSPPAPTRWRAERRRDAVQP